MVGDNRKDSGAEEDKKIEGERVGWGKFHRKRKISERKKREEMV